MAHKADHHVLRRVSRGWGRELGWPVRTGVVVGQGDSTARPHAQRPCGCSTHRPSMQWSHSAAQQAQGRVWAPAHHHAQAEREVELAALQDDHRLVVQPHALACGEEERGTGRNREQWPIDGRQERAAVRDHACAAHARCGSPRCLPHSPPARPPTRRAPRPAPPTPLPPDTACTRQLYPTCTAMRTCGRPGGWPAGGQPIRGWCSGPRRAGSSARRRHPRHAAPGAFLLLAPHWRDAL